MTRRRVVITGLGLVTPLGLGAADFWSALAQGRSAVTRVNFLNQEGEPRHAVARLPQFDVRSLVPDRKLLRVMCDSDRYALAAAQMAVTEAGPIAPAPERRGAFVGTRKELMAYEMLREASVASMDEQGHISSTRLGELGYPLIPPLTLVTGMPNGCLFALSVLHSVKGSGANLIGSGEVGLGAIGAAYRGDPGGTGRVGSRRSPGCGGQPVGLRGPARARTALPMDRRTITGGEALRSAPRRFRAGGRRRGDRPGGVWRAH